MPTAFQLVAKAVLDRELHAFADVSSRTMFGCPAYFGGDKLFACLYGEGVAVKLSADEASRCIEASPHAHPFQPYNRAPMRGRVQFHHAIPKDVLDDLDAIRRSMAFVRA
jgi:hypothetical protein